MPGRVNLIGEHIDYHQLSVLPMAIQREITADFEQIESACVHVESADFGSRELLISDSATPSPAGDWANYLKAAVQAVKKNWTINKGFGATVTSDLPWAAGLSSSSALLTLFALGLLRANGINPTLEALMSLLPEGEHFVGTRGGGMDHAAVLASRSGCASLLHFEPFAIEHIPIPQAWRFLVADSLTRAEKSGADKVRYNACREAGSSALLKLGIADFRQARTAALSQLSAEERNAVLHVSGETERVTQAVAAMRRCDVQTFGRLLNESHASLRDLLKVSSPALNQIVDIAIAAGADGARLTGAGFGGCAIVLCNEATQGYIIAALERDFYAARREYNRDRHLISVLPSNGALYAND